MNTADNTPTTTTTTPEAPLAARVRPTSLSEFIGQTHLLKPNSPLRRFLDNTSSGSIILYGPPGTGKTTLAKLLAQSADRNFISLIATTAGVKELRSHITQAIELYQKEKKGTTIFIDEAHRFSRTQQDVLLSAVESGDISLILATTENPSVSLVAPLLSRSVLLTLKPLTDEDISQIIDRATNHKNGLAVNIESQARQMLIRYAGGDARRALTALEIAAGGTQTVTVEQVAESFAQVSARYDRTGDMHYDIISAFIKSIRGSDPDAALHYLARMIEAGEDPRFIARRLIILASEDIGLADPNALVHTTAVATAVGLVGMPEARLALAQGTIYLSLAPKSNSIYKAVNEATADVKAGITPEVPAQLRDPSTKTSRANGSGKGYRYPHDEDGFVAVRYVENPISSKTYYKPTKHGAENKLGEILNRLRNLINQHNNT